MKIKRILAVLMAAFMVAAMVACGGNNTPASTPAADGGNTPAPAPGGDTPAPDSAPADGGSITLWTYPIGNWGDEASVKAITDAFTAETGIAVQVEYLSYTDGDDKVNAAITGGNAPDLVMEGPERLVANWGVNGHMVDLSDMLDATDKQEIYASVLKSCTAPDGAVYEYPLVMTAHCMGINLDAFKEAGADQYLNLTTHTWTTDDFFKAVDALYAKYGDTVAAVFCGGQGGDQGTRALVNNLYGGTFTNAEHTQYTWDDAKNIQALQKLYDTNGINYDAGIVGGDEIALFYQGILKMAFCWNVAQQLNPNSANTGEGLTMNGEEIVCMAFPSESGTPELCGGIWGFGIFDNGDATRIENAKKFLKYACDSANAVDAIRTANYFPARTAAEGTDFSGVWSDNAIMQEYQGLMMPIMGDYYQVTSGWAGARTAWWETLQDVGNGTDVATAVAAGVAKANEAAANAG